MKKLLLFVMIGFMLSACSNTGTNNTPRKERIEITNDLENAKAIIPSWKGEKRVIEMTNPPAHSGIYACYTNDTSEFSYFYEETLSNINSEVPKRVVLSGWVYTTVANPTFAVICSIHEKQEQYNWKSFPLAKVLPEAGKWVEFSGDFYLDDKPLKPDMTLGIGTWNESKKAVYIDDLKVTFLY
jgi:hypothetical protein